MYRNVKFVLVACAILSVASNVGAQNRSFEVPAARTQGVGGALTLPSTASPRAVLAQHLRGQGRNQRTADSLVESGRRPGRAGVTHVQFEQRAAGLPVYGTYARAAFGAGGELINLAENVASVPSSVRRADISAQQAISAAIASLYPSLRSVPDGFFRNAPSATRVAIPHGDGSMTTGFVVETWTQQGNRLHETLVDGDGIVLHQESRTSNDAYNVFRINPNVTPQAVATGPGSTTESPSGWLFAGTQGSTQISGNNVSAYLDVVSNNRSDALGAPVADGDFLTVADLTTTPSAQRNRNVAVQNLFYLNNLVHDELYRHGFTEAAANFQENNFGRGGRGSDSVNAEGQDGGGTDNANFATPREGSNPRMQMYLWTGKGTHHVLAGGFTFLAQGAEFGPALNTTGVSSTIVLVNDGSGTTSDGCEPFTGVAGGIAFIDRGTCAFTVKVKNAQDAGAVAAIVANNQGGDDIFVMAGTDATITIPSVFISQNSGNTLEATLPDTGTVRLADNPPLQRDGDIDADIVFHEYCHGLTWRMIGSMGGPMSGAIGEGMSDICAMLLTVVRDDGTAAPGADVIGEYSFSNLNGIRREPYAGYDLRTYGTIEWTEVHNDGEPYAAIGWRMLELFGTARRGDLFGYLVDGMNYTPSGPTYEEMRDGILQSIANSPSLPGDDCHVWRAFAQYGVGVGATATVRKNRVTVTESFTRPTACQ
jgi:extracellular elastinolytic metalloproteinase